MKSVYNDPIGAGVSALKPTSLLLACGDIHDFVSLFNDLSTILGYLMPNPSF